MIQLLTQFHQVPSLLHDADTHINAFHASMVAEREKPKLDMAEMAIRSGFTSDAAKYRPFSMLGSVAVLPVRGMLLHNFDWSSNWATGYQVIQRQLKAALEDDEVKGIYMPFATPGGTVAGCPDTADFMAEVGKVKPIWTLANDSHYSAGQWLAAQGTRRLATQSGGAGSIGVVVTHLDYSEAVKNSKVKVDYIFSGAHKVDRSPYEKMPTAVRARIQADVDNTRQKFATAVSRGTGLDIQAVLDTEAQIYSADEAKDIGLIEEIVSSIHIVDEFNEHLASAGKTTLIMGAQTAMELTPEQQAAQEKAIATAVAQATKDATKAERERVAGIIALPEAEGRGDLANQLAATEGMSVDVAKGLLNAAPKATVESPTQDENNDQAAAALAALGKNTPEALETGGEQEEQTATEKDIQSLASAYRG